jgi:hypothetical protein
MHTMRNTFAGIVAMSAVIFTLSGCSSSEQSTVVEVPTQIQLTTEPQLFVNEETGHITKYVDSFSETVFESDYSSEDTGVNTSYEVPPPAPTSAMATTLTSSVVIDGTGYETHGTVHWRMPEGEALYTFYNRYIASPDAEHFETLKDMGVANMVNTFINQQIDMLTVAGDVPKLSFAVVMGPSIDRNPSIAAIEASGVEAWQAFFDINGVIDGVELDLFEYRYACARYSVSNNLPEVASALNLLFADKGIEFRIDSPYSSVTEAVWADTKAPCDVMYKGMTPEEYQEHQNTEPVKPDNDTYYPEG